MIPSYMYFESGLKGHSQLWDRAELDNSFSNYEKSSPQPEIKIHRDLKLQSHDAGQSNSSCKNRYLYTTKQIDDSFTRLSSYVITLKKWLWNHKPKLSGSAVNFDNVMTHLIINDRTDA